MIFFISVATALVGVCIFILNPLFMEINSEGEKATLHVIPEYVGEVESVHIYEDQENTRSNISYIVMIKGTPWITTNILFVGDRICRHMKDGDFLLGLCLGME